jgi:hypothetical protein
MAITMRSATEHETEKMVRDFCDSEFAEIAFTMMAAETPPRKPLVVEILEDGVFETFYYPSYMLRSYSL